MSTDFSDVSIHPTPSPRDGAASEQQQQPSQPLAASASSTSVNMGDHPQSTASAYVQKSMASFYATREGAFERAVNDIKSTVYNQEIDGSEIIGTWLLIEIDHWDTETEKVVMLTTESLLTVRYDFVPMKVYKHKRTALKDLDTLQFGNFHYPKYSLVSLIKDLNPRSCGGVRLCWNKGVAPGFIQRWKPKSDSMDWITFTYHPLIGSPDRDTAIYNVQEFANRLIEVTNAAYATHNAGRMFAVTEKDIEQTIYLGLPSQIHNQSFLGMSKERGGISF